MVYDNIDKIAPSATTEMTDTQVMDLVAGWATAVSGIPAAELKKGVSCYIFLLDHEEFDNPIFIYY